MTRDVDRFLRTFFGDGNDLSFELMVESEKPEIRELLDPSIRNLGAESGLVFLPRRIGQRMLWYVGAPDSEVLEARDLVRAFIGETYSSYDGTHRVPLDKADPVERACLMYPEVSFFKFEVWPAGSVEHQKRVNHQIQLIWSLREAAPTRAVSPERPIWRVLFDFEQALRQGDRKTAELLLEELETGRSFTEPNLTFLEIRFLHAFEEWEAILSLERMPTLLEIQRPKSVSGAILDALYQIRLRPLIDDRTLDSTEVAEGIAALDLEYGPIFQSDPKPLTASSALLTALAACVTKPPRVDQVERLVESAADAGFPILDELTSLLGEDAIPQVEEEATEQVASSPLAAAQRALSVGDLDLAHARAIEAPPGVERTTLLLVTAKSIGTLKAVTVALDAYDRLVGDDAATPLGPFLQQLADELSRSISARGKDVDGWLAWGRAFSEPEFPPSAPDLARAGVNEWTSDLSDTELLEFAQTVEALTESEGAYLLQAIPSLLDAFPVNQARPAHRSLYVAFLNRLVEDEGHSEQSLEAILEILDGTLRLGPDADMYEDLIAYCEIVWQQAASPRAAEWAVDTCSTLAYHPSPLPGRVLAYVQAVLGRLVSWPHVLDPMLKSSLRFIGEVLEIDVEASLPEASAPEPESPDPWSRLDGKLIGIYTLTESAAQQAEKVILDLAPGCRVERNAEHDCSPRLRSLAGNADLFVLVKRSATHAAADCVQDHRGDAPTVVPIGKGSSSILRALEEGLAELV